MPCIRRLEALKLARELDVQAESYSYHASLGISEAKTWQVRHRRYTVGLIRVAFGIRQTSNGISPPAQQKLSGRSTVALHTVMKKLLYSVCVCMYIYAAMHTHPTFYFMTK